MEKGIVMVYLPVKRETNKAGKKERKSLSLPSNIFLLHSESNN